MMISYTLGEAIERIHRLEGVIKKQAARIERLEKALRDVHAAAGNNHLIANIARAALEDKS